MVIKAQSPQPAQGLASPSVVYPQKTHQHDHHPLLDRQVLTESRLNAPLREAALQTSGGPDEFGYRWDDSQPFAWIDATHGTDTGMQGDSYGQGVGPIPLPFSFKYYENSYSQLWIAASGYVAFTDAYWSAAFSVPSPNDPNSLIAPYTTPVQLAKNGPTQRVYYSTGGIAPNRYFVAEWYQVQDEFGGVFTFEVVLYEDGSIDFQFEAMRAGNGCYVSGSGIEDSTGLDGLSYPLNCFVNLSNQRVHFQRPPISARLSIAPKQQGQLTSAGRGRDFRIPIRNTGELGADTYDLTVASTWPVTLFQADGSTRLTDSDGDSIIDTGVITQGGMIEVIAQIQTPVDATVGQFNSAELTVRSLRDLSKSKVVRLQNAIPTAFAQVFRDNSDGAMSLYLAQPNGQSFRTVTPDFEYGDSPAVAEIAPGNFIYLWSTYHRISNQVESNELNYALINQYGNLIRTPTRLTNHLSAVVDTYDNTPVIAVLPNHNVGILWIRRLYDAANRQNANLYFAILNPSGVLIAGPENLTNNSKFGIYSDLDLPSFAKFDLAATSDNRFVMTWLEQRTLAPGGGCTQYCSIADVFLAARNTTGEVLTPNTKLTDSSPIGSYYYLPTLAQLSNAKTLLVYYKSHDGDLAYLIVNSDGSIAKAPTALTEDHYDFYESGYLDASQLSDGNIIIAWLGYKSSDPKYVIRYAILDAAFQRVVAATPLDNPIASKGESGLSVTADDNGHAILTTQDSYSGGGRHLYYSLIQSGGNILTPPMIYRTPVRPGYSFETNFSGYGSAPYHWTPPIGSDVVVTSASLLVGSAPGGTVRLTIGYSNHAATATQGMVLNVEMDSRLTYQRDSVGVPASIDDNQVSWNLPNLFLLDQKQFDFFVALPTTASEQRQAATIGDQYPLTVTFTMTNPEITPADNSTVIEVMSANQTFLPTASQVK